MRQPAYELIFAVCILGVLALGYVGLARGGVPQPTSAAGYALGITGFGLMLATEILYSLRKRLPRFHFGAMRHWLQLHVCTGLIGPFLVLLHSGWKFHGLAGGLTLLLAVVVFSGLVGRYIYTAVPRTLDGVEVEAADLEGKIAAIDKELQQRDVQGLAEGALVVATQLPRQGWLLVLARPLLRRRLRRQLRWLMRDLDRDARAQAAPLEELLLRRQRLQMEVLSLEATRRLLAWWHLFHVPLSSALFLLAFVHIGGALYYSAFLR
jgi:hypothetical protein